MNKQILKTNSNQIQSFIETYQVGTRTQYTQSLKRQQSFLSIKVKTTTYL